MVGVFRASWQVLRVGGWAPLLVFSAHLFIGGVLNAYDFWPPIDVPMHFLGGLAMAFFISRCFQTLPRHVVPGPRLAVLELLLAASLTATAAVFWEFAEFSLDQVAGTNIQVSLANTIKDLALGISGALVYVMVRASRLRAGAGDLKELAMDWLRGQAA